MANSNRLFTDKNGNMFIPMNVEGGNWNEHFITTPKLACIVLMIVSAIFIGAYLTDLGSPISSYFIFYGAWLIICFYVLRFVVFEEKFYYKMYKQLKESEITTPAIFWDIASIKDTIDGAILTYSDAKIGILVRIERDTITGKSPEFKETHYDAISDFYKDVMLHKYNFVQLNIMEQAGNDPRLEQLDALVYKNENPNIRVLMEKQIGYIKNITHHTLYESDYFLFYTSDLSKIDVIIDEVIDMIYKLLDGAFIGYRVLRARDIIEFVKEQYGVKYFNYTEATLSMFKTHGISTNSPFNIVTMVYSDGETQSISQLERNKIKKMASDVLNGTLDISQISIKEALKPMQNKNDKPVDFDSLSEGFTQRPPMQQSGKRRPMLSKNKGGKNNRNGGNPGGGSMGGPQGGAQGRPQGGPQGGYPGSQQYPQRNQGQPMGGGQWQQNPAGQQGWGQPQQPGYGQQSGYIQTQQPTIPGQRPLIPGQRPLNQQNQGFKQDSEDGFNFDGVFDAPENNGEQPGQGYQQGQAYPEQQNNQQGNQGYEDDILDF